MKPEEVFRFVNARPVQRAPAGRIERRFAAYHATEKSPFHRALERVQGSEARQKAAELARKRLAQNDLDLKALEVVLHAVRGVEDQPTAEKARAKLKTLLDSGLNEYLKSREFRQLKDSLWDRLYAHTLVPEEKPDERGTVYEGLRALHFLELVAKQPAQEKPLTRAEIAAVRLLIPPSLLPDSPSRQQPKDEREKKETLAKLDTLHNQVTALNKAAAELRNNDRLYKAQQVHVASRVVALPPTLVERPLADDTPAGASRAANAAPRKVLLEQREELVPRKSPWVFEEFGKKNLSVATQKLLSARKSNLLEMELGELVGELEVEKYNLVSNFLTSLPQGAVQHVRSSPKFEMLLKEAAVPGLYILPYLPAAEAIDPTTATARGIQPLGIGDLLVVRQELQRYTAGEVAHIENVLKSEFKTRMHSRIRETEEIIITETERIEENEKDLQTTERFELHKEAQSTIENKMSLDAGVSVTASYGPVSVTAHADFALDQSSSESSKTASDFAKEITEKSVSRIMQRSREERTRRTLERFEERNEHGFDNKLGSGHVIGIYRWVDKYYKARLINYGKRLLIEFIVPEPAAFYLHLQSNQPLEGVTLEKPEEPMVYGRKLQPDDLNKSNINYYVAKYNVQDVDPYPAETVRVSAAFAESTGTTENASYAKTAEKLQVPAGYKCVDVFGQRGYQGISGSGYFLETFIAGEPWGSVVASGLEGIIPISVKGWMQAFHVNVVAICELKPETRKGLAAQNLRRHHGRLPARPGRLQRAGFRRPNPGGRRHPGAQPRVQSQDREGRAKERRSAPAHQQLRPHPRGRNLALQRDVQRHAGQRAIRLPRVQQRRGPGRGAHPAILRTGLRVEQRHLSLLPLLLGPQSPLEPHLPAHRHRPAVHRLPPRRGRPDHRPRPPRLQRDRSSLHEHQRNLERRHASHPQRPVVHLHRGRAQI